MRKFAMAVTVFLASLGFAMADTFQAEVTNVDGSNVTFQKYKKGEKGKKGEKEGDPMTLPVAKDCKFVKGKFDMEAKKLVAGDPIEGGLKGIMKGSTYRITTSDDNKSITEFMQFGGGGGKKKKDKEKDK